jgi:hypothetical protein
MSSRRRNAMIPDRPCKTPMSHVERALSRRDGVRRVTGQMLPAGIAGSTERIG